MVHRHTQAHGRYPGPAGALLAVGFQLRLGYLRGNGAHGQAIQITLFESAMPPMITAAILATKHDLDPLLATLMVTEGLVISFATLTGWWWVMRGV
jgi:predicted permease